MAKVYCRECGKELKNGEGTCPYCGTSTGKVLGQIVNSQQEVKAGTVANRAEVVYASDNGLFGFTALGFLLMPLGYVMFFLLRKTQVRRAHAWLAGAVLMTIFLMIVLVGQTGILNEISF